MRLRNKCQAPADVGMKHQVSSLQPHSGQRKPQTMVGTDTKMEQILPSSLCPRTATQLKGRVTAIHAHSEAGRKTEMETG